jgi:2-isopropylmalate synthase
MRGGDLKRYEHVAPELVGNQRRLLVTDLSDADLMNRKLAELGLECTGESLVRLLDLVRSRRDEGWVFDAAEASFHLLVLKHLKKYRPAFETQHFDVHARGCVPNLDDSLVEASVKVKLGNNLVHTICEGGGPVHALYSALRKALLPTYPQLDDMQLCDYSVRVTKANDGVAGKVRVHIESRDRFHDRTFGTMGVSENIITATWNALVDAVDYKHMLDAKMYAGA